MVEYSASVQRQAAAELELLPIPSAIEGMLGDYHVMRVQARACAAASG